MENKQEPVTVLEVAKTLEAALLEDKPYSLTTINKDGESTSEVSREEFLEFYSNWAMETIYNIVGDEETDNKTNLKELAHELDHEIGGLLLSKIKIDDIQTMAGHLSEDVENMNPEKFKYYYHEFSHRLRVIADFLHYVSKDLDTNYEALHKLKSDLFEKVVKPNEF